MRRTRIRISPSDRVYLFIIYTMLGLFTLSVVYPLLYVVSASFSSPYALIAGKVFLFPVEFGFRGYEAVFRSSQVLVGYLNSFLYTVVGVLFSLTAMFLAAFPLSRKEFPARKIITLIFAFTMFFNGGLIPTYLLVKQLGMLDTLWSMVVPGAVSIFAIIICRTYIKSAIPEELFEASSIDGCDYIRYLLKIIIPLSKPIIAVMALNFATGIWNSYFSAMIFLKSPARFPLQLVLRNILVQNVVDMTSLKNLNVKDEIERQYIGELMKYSLIVVSSLPLLVLYPFVQKYFIKGVMVGSIKG